MHIKHRLWFASVLILLTAIIVVFAAMPAASVEANEKDYIKWVDFNIPYSVLKRTMDLDIDSFQQEIHLNWIDLLAYLSCKCGGNWSSYKSSDLDAVVKRLNAGEEIGEITKNMKYFSFYRESIGAVLGEFLGPFQREVPDREHEGQTKIVDVYGLKVFSPIAEGYGYSHYRDFGSSRSYGYSRPHLGHDLMGQIGTPITATESGVVESMGWNQYGGWRIGIRSFDTKRYYYYAHLRKDHPYAANLKEGDIVKAGDIIGYLGMTGYSTEENVNGMKAPHLHFGVQLIFDESQKDGVNQIWVDCYDLIKLLEHNRVTVVKDEKEKEYRRKYQIYDRHFSGFES